MLICRIILEMRNKTTMKSTTAPMMSSCLLSWTHWSMKTFSVLKTIICIIWVVILGLLLLLLLLLPLLQILLCLILRVSPLELDGKIQSCPPGTMVSINMSPRSWVLMILQHWGSFYRLGFAVVLIISSCTMSTSVWISVLLSTPLAFAILLLCYSNFLYVLYFEQRNIYASNCWCVRMCLVCIRRKESLLCILFACMSPYPLFPSSFTEMHGSNVNSFLVRLCISKKLNIYMQVDKET